MASREQLSTFVRPDSAEVSLAVASEIAQHVADTASSGTSCVLGLATGSTPQEVYRELVRKHKQEGLSFSHVSTFNLDEYWPMQPGALQSYHRFMHEHLFDHIDIPPASIHIPDGGCPLEHMAEHCAAYEEAIKAAGGIDLQLLGLGRTGHIGFNESGSPPTSTTRLITLDDVTRIDAASDFFGESHVPRRAITMGIHTILQAKRIILMAFGENKAGIVAKAVEGPVTPAVAASFLQQHPETCLYLDSASSAGLTRCQSPWVLGPVDWQPHRVKQAAIWLSQRVRKPLLKLTDADYNANSLHDLIEQQGPAYSVNLYVFYALQRSITGWPGGKPDRGAATSSPVRRFAMQYNAFSPAADSPRAGEAFPKRILIMSPHPDDDVISMGGTFIRLVEQGHEVHVAYQTSGNIAVWDEDAIRFADFAAQFGQVMGLDASRTSDIAAKIEAFLQHKQPGQVDSVEVQRVKTLIRYCEARSAGRTCGAKVENLHFLDMPFYETGAVVKKPLGPEDIQILVNLFDKVRPHQIYAAGDLSDPHGTHRVCLQAIFKALEEVHRRDWWAAASPVVWLYRGAWQEWAPWEAGMVVPLSPGELNRKIDAIFKHQSQKDRALFPGADSREFWQRAQARNQATAQLYDQLGLPEYEAMEAFVQYDPAAVASGASILGL